MEEYVAAENALKESAKAADPMSVLYLRHQNLAASLALSMMGV